MKRRVIFSLTPLLLGLLLFWFIESKPRFETYRGSDVWTLVGSGALVAIGLAGLFGRIKLPGE